MITTVARTSASYGFHTLVFVSAILAWLTLVDADSASCQNDSNTQYQFFVGNRSTGEGQLDEVAVPFYIGRSDAPKAGDVVKLDSFTLTLGSPGSYTCRYSERESKKVFYISPDGEEQLIGIMVNEFYTEHETTLNNPLLHMNDSERSLLRSVYLDAWPEGIEKILAKLNTENVCITITDKTAYGQKRDRGGSIPRLPRDLSCLRVVNEHSRGIEDFTALSELNKLRSLAIVDWSGKIDLSRVFFSKKLHFLEIKGATLINYRYLALLADLRVLLLDFVDGLNDIEFASDLKKLERLSVNYTKVSNLEPLAGLPELRIVSASPSSVSSLPSGPIPRLKSLNVILSKLDDSEVRRFQHNFPNVDVRFRLNDALRSALKNTDRIRIRTGDTCHSLPGRERVIHELKDRDQIHKLIDSIEVDEEDAGFNSGCCGEVVFEFYKNQKLLASTGFHHGRSISWAEGWPGDALLTQRSAEFLARWLAARGYKDVLKKQQRERARKRAMHERFRRYRQIFPKTKELFAYNNPAARSLWKRFEDIIPNQTIRAAVALRLFGCHNGTWLNYDPVEQALERQILARIPIETVMEALRQNRRDLAMLDGTARWFFGSRAAVKGKNWEYLMKKSNGELLSQIVRRALGHPKKTNRRLALMVLPELPATAVKETLRIQLERGLPKIRLLPKGDEIDPGRLFVARSSMRDLPEGCSRRAAVALTLAYLRDHASKEKIRELLRKASSVDKRIYKRALELLNDNP